MKNLAGETKADLHILKELSEAGIEIAEGPRAKGEVPYTLTGKLGDWGFTRAWYYWVASASEGKGLPVDIATKLHNKKYLKAGEVEPSKYGQVVRVAGDCGCPTPNKRAKHYDSKGLELIVDPNGKEEAKLKGMITYRPDMKKYFEKYRFVPSLKGFSVKSLVDSYHIDSQEGLNALAEVIRGFQNITSSGTDPKRIQQLEEKISALYTEWSVYEEDKGIEWWKKIADIPYENVTVNELIVGISKEGRVVSIAQKLKSNKDGYKGIAQYFFDKGIISGFNYGMISGPGAPLDRGPEMDDKLRPHFEELKKIKPESAISLEYYLKELEIPGPEYKAKPDFPGK